MNDRSKELFETVGKITEYIDEINERVRKEKENNNEVGG